ncbi:MAG: RnfABCDGE type electron transport complex subunit B [Pseudomonadota bacterium]|nr:RnfABCDGE type electron transport complex subunit B [Pseudomonadota bacterium]
MFVATLVLTALGLLLGWLLGLAARVFAVEENPIVNEVEALLPGSQCGQCGFPGCSAAAEAMVEGNAAVNCCPPGGRALTESLAELLNIDLNSLGDAPVPQLATIDETLCTGCTKCYKACPTDAIVGATRQIHAVISKACTGCSKCKDVCPEDCISLNPEPLTLNTWHWTKPEAA